MKILFCEGSSLSARETLTALGPLRHTFVICDPNPFCLCRFTAFKAKWYSCPSINSDPDGYFRTITDIIEKEKIDVLLPNHEQALLFSARLPDLSSKVKIALPAFQSYLELFSKVRFMKFLERMRLPYPATRFAANPSEISTSIFYPCFLKTDFGTASTGVWHLQRDEDFRKILPFLPENGNTFLIQAPAPGIFEIAYGLFNHGSLVSLHCCQRLAEGAGGSSSQKIGIDRPIVAEHFSVIGEELNWHGPLAIDYFYDFTTNTPYYIDASPRLVEPMNAVLNGINQPEELLNISTDALKLPDIKPTAAKKSHMLLMSLLLAAEQSASRFQLISILLDSLFKRNAYKDSSEELTPFKVDWVSVFPVFFIFLTLLICPGLSKKISGSTVNNYALQYPAIMKIIARYSAPV